MRAPSLNHMASSKLDARADDAGQCCICLNSLDTEGLGRRWLPCGHAMHELCVTELRRHVASGRCPLCRASHADLTPVQVLMDRAAVHYRRKEFEEAVNLWTEVLSVEPSNASAAVNLGSSYSDGQGVPRDLARGMELFEEARRGGDTKAAFSLGVLYEQQGDLRKARDLYEEARRGGYAKASYNLGLLYHQQGDLRKARDLYEEARRGGLAEAACALGVLYRRQGDLRKARELFEEARRGGFAEAACALGVLYQRQGDLRKATELFEEARRGGVAKAALNLGVLYEQQGDLRKAREFWEEARRGGDAEAASALGALDQQQGDLRKARDLYEEGRRGGDAKAAFVLGFLDQEQGDLRKARDLYEEARRGGVAQAALNLGVLYRRQGDLRKARELFEEARRGGVAKAAGALGALYQQQGDLRKARELWEEARRGGDAEAADALTIMQSSGAFSHGDSVKIHGLCSPTGRLLNGQVGTIVNFDHRTSRYGVKVAGSDQPMAIQGKNLAKVDLMVANNAAASEPILCSDFKVADLVWIQGLISDAALPLNGCSGQIVSFRESTGRFGVEVHGGHGLKAIRPENLRHVIDQSQLSAPAGRAQSNEELAATIEELSAQAAIEASALEARASQDAGIVNAQVSDALVRSSPADDGPRAFLLKFSRPSA